MLVFKNTSRNAKREINSHQHYSKNWIKFFMKALLANTQNFVSTYTYSSYDVNNELCTYMSVAAYLQFMHLTLWHQNNCPLYSEKDLGFKRLPITFHFRSWQLYVTTHFLSNADAKRVNKFSEEWTLSIGHDPEPPHPTTYLSKIHRNVIPLLLLL
jgi:hypothetical protein